MKSVIYVVLLHLQANAFHSFITSLLVLDPAKRPTAADVLKHPWLQNTPDKPG